MSTTTQQIDWKQVGSRLVAHRAAAAKREARRLSRETVADDIGVHYNTVKNVEGGKVATTQTMLALAQYYQTTVEDLTAS